MKRKKHLFLFLLAVSVAGVIALVGSRADGDTNYMTGSTEAWEADPPQVDSVWVQKLEFPLSGGRNMIMRIKYASYNTLPDTIRVYHGSSGSVLFNDKGVLPDLVANDHNYGAYLVETPGVFESQMTTLNSNIVSRGSITYYEGHDGYTIDEPALFDLTGFNNHQEVPIPIHLAWGIDCTSELKRDYSLFITKLAVTEDTVRTYNVVDSTGNPLGAWTFGHMIKNMASVTADEDSAKAFLKAWVTNWLEDVVVNGQTVMRRDDARLFLIYPWLIKANPGFVASSPLFGTHTIQGAANFLMARPGYWDTLWNNTPAYDLLINAPFKLSAIVNRIDLRGNPAYNQTMQRAGETRFIFSLIAPVSVACTTTKVNTAAGMIEPFGANDEHGGVLVAGTVPTPGAQGDGKFNQADWCGMNVILEYSNPQTSICAVQNFAEEWADLSTLSNVGSSDYNAALQAITDQVIATNAIPGRPNGSGIGRIRTNERLFFPSGASPYGNNSNAASVASWDQSAWELRQFEINALTRNIEQVPLTNTPVSGANYIKWNADLTWFPTVDNGQCLTDQAVFGFPGGTGVMNPFGSDPNKLVANDTLCADLVDWAFRLGIQKAILKERHVMPKYFPGTATPMLAGSALLQLDYVHIWSFKWQANTPWHPYSLSPTNTYDQADSYRTDRMIRHRLSINTCQGCHAGETKTIFTQVRPLGYGEEADYMGSTPGYHSSSSAFEMKLDTRGVYNGGTSNVKDGSSWRVDPNYSRSRATANYYFQKVSAFITGRSYTGPLNTPSYDDDAPNDLWDDEAARPGSHFFVNDPINTVVFNQYDLPPRVRLNPPNPIEPDESLQHAFNELDRRTEDMCNLLNSDCNSGSVLFTVFLDITKQPIVE